MLASIAQHFWVRNGQFFQQNFIVADYPKSPMVFNAAFNFYTKFFSLDNRRLFR